MTPRGPFRPLLTAAVLGVSTVGLLTTPAASGKTPPPGMPPQIRVSSLPAAKPVAPKVENTAMNLASQVVDSDPAAREVKPRNGFSLAVFRWKNAQPDSIQWRSRTETGAWSPWHSADAEDAGPDQKTARRVSEPVWTGPATRIQVKATKAGAPATQQLSVVTIDPGTSTNDTMASPQTTGSGVPDQPTVVTRAQWGADESQM